MNDITPPSKPDQNSVSSQPVVDTHVAPRKRRWPWIVGGLVALLLITGGFLGWRYWVNRDVYAKVGNYTITKQQFDAAKRSITSADKANNGSSEESIDNRARDLLVLNAALKNDADKAGISYGQGDVDVFAKPQYDEVGGKQFYLLKMKSLYDWTESDANLRLVNQYLQSKLANSLLAKREYSMVYVRWDSIETYNPNSTDAKGVEEKALQRLQTDYLPLFQNGSTADALEKAVDINAEVSAANTAGVIMVEKKGAETRFSKFDQSLVFNVDNKSEGEDFNKKVQSLSKPGQYVGPFRANGGVFAIVRLESSAGGKFVSWDQYTKTQTANFHLVSPLQKLLSVLNWQQARIQEAARAVSTPARADGPVDCLQQHPVNYHFQFRDQSGNPVGGGSVWSNSWRAVRNCNKEDYPKHNVSNAFGSNTYSVGSNYTTGGIEAYPVGAVAVSNFGDVQMDLDCNGDDWRMKYFAPNGYDIVNSLSDTLRPLNNVPDVTITIVVKKRVGVVSIVKRVPNNNGGWVAGSAGGSGTKACIGLVCDSSIWWGWSGVEGVQNTTVNSVASGWKYVGSDIAYSSNCQGHKAGTESNPSESTADKSYAVRICAGQTVVRYLDFEPTSQSGSGKIVVKREPTFAKGSNPATCIDSACATVDSWSKSFSIDKTNRDNNLYSVSTKSVPAGWQFNNATASYDNCEGHNGDEAKGTQSFDVRVCSDKTVTVTFRYKPATPLKPDFGPWLQTLRGDMGALGNIVNQAQGTNGARPSAATDKEAEYVVMGYVVNNICSKRGYVFGGSACQYSGDGYYLNNTNLADIGTASDPVVSNIKDLLSHGAASNTSCTPKQPYFVDTNITGNFQSNQPFPATPSCAVIGQINTSHFDAEHNFSGGRATIYVDPTSDGTLYIDKNNKLNYSGAYASVNQIPNVGIIVHGDVVISPDVTELDMSIYATGKIKTCSSYPSANCNKPLTVKGMLAAAGGFEFGRNYFVNSGGDANSNTQVSNEPAEKVIGSGLIDAFPPPGFNVVSNLKGGGVRYLSTEANPRF